MNYTYIYNSTKLISGERDFPNRLSGPRKTFQNCLFLVWQEARNYTLRSGAASKTSQPSPLEKKGPISFKPWPIKVLQGCGILQHDGQPLRPAPSQRRSSGREAVSAPPPFPRGAPDASRARGALTGRLRAGAAERRSRPLTLGGGGAAASTGPSPPRPSERHSAFRDPQPPTSRPRRPPHLSGAALTRSGRLIPRPGRGAGCRHAPRLTTPPGNRAPGADRPDRSATGAPRLLGWVERRVPRSGLRRGSPAG